MNIKKDHIIFTNETITDLENVLYEKFRDIHLSKGQKKTIVLLLDEIKRHDKNTFLHSIRVGLLGVKISIFLELDQKPLFYAGLFHDYGKTSVDEEILRKTDGFSESDFKKVQKHAWVGYFALRKIYPFSADILLRHHHYSQNPYPENVPKTKYDEALIEKYAKILALIDFYDSLISRNNERFNIDINDKHSVKELLIEYHKEQEWLINDLFEKEIF